MKKVTSGQRPVTSKAAAKKAGANHQAPAQPKRRRQQGLPQVNAHAAGIDVGSREHFAAVPSHEGGLPTVRHFSTVTADLVGLADWLAAEGIKTVALESTGVYWIPVFQILDERGLEVILVNPEHVKNISGRKSDVSDSQWLQQLHSYGLLRGSFRPEDAVCVLRSYVRARASLVRDAQVQVMRMQKSLQQMNVQLHHAISDITGFTGQAIMRAILDGERDTMKLAALRDPHTRRDTAQIARMLEGDYRPEHLFTLRLALELYDCLQQKILACDEAIGREVARFQPKKIVEEATGADGVKTQGRLRTRATTQAAAAAQLRRTYHGLLGVDLTAVPGIGLPTVITLIAETGWDMSRWASDKHFSSWLGVCTQTRISGGKPVGGKKRRTHNRAADTLRLAAQAAMNSKTFIGATIRRLRAKLGPASALTAGAHKLAIIIYHMLRDGTPYHERGQDAYDHHHHSRTLHHLQRRAANLGYQLVPAPSAIPVS